jgi:hypothetical protein
MAFHYISAKFTDCAVISLDTRLGGWAITVVPIFVPGAGNFDWVHLTSVLLFVSFKSVAYFC